MLASGSRNHYYGSLSTDATFSLQVRKGTCWDPMWFKSPEKPTFVNTLVNRDTFMLDRPLWNDDANTEHKRIAAHQELGLLDVVRPCSADGRWCQEQLRALVRDVEFNGIWCQVASALMLGGHFASEMFWVCPRPLKWGADSNCFYVWCIDGCDNMLSLFQWVLLTHCSRVRWMSPFYRWRIRGLVSLCILSKVIQMISCRGRLQPEDGWPQLFSYYPLTLCE